MSAIENRGEVQDFGIQSMDYLLYMKIKRHAVFTIKTEGQYAVSFNVTPIHTIE